MMHQKERFFAAENENYQTVVLPYGNGSYEMVVLLPREGKDLSSLLQTMDAKKWKDNLKNTYSSEVDLKLPRFTSAYTRELNDVLKLLGMNTMFERGKADLTKMSKAKAFVSMVFYVPCQPSFHVCYCRTQYGYHLFHGYLPRQVNGF